MQSYKDINEGEIDCVDTTYSLSITHCIQKTCKSVL